MGMWRSLRSFTRGVSMVVVAAALLTGCATGRSPPSPGGGRAAAQVKLLDGPPMTPHRKIRQVQAFACAHDFASQPDVVAAREQLRSEAARLGGDAVGNVMCHEEDARRHHGCWKVARCTGDAFRVR
jgi:hypothetical protein